ncbi:maltokinase N-terminal cap-like domain-containing protein [Mariniluteicoccus flavus]
MFEKLFGKGDDDRRSLLWQHMQGARWFGGKGRDGSLVSLTALPALTVADELPLVRFEIAEVAYDDGDRETHFYLLPLAYRDADSVGSSDSLIGSAPLDDLGSVEVHDATRDPVALDLLLAMMLGEAEHADERGSVTSHLPDATGLTAGLAPRVFGGQQSNTSIMYADVAMLKLFRRLELGRNLDIEVHDAFGGDVANAARLFGWIEVTWQHDGETLAADAGMLVEQLREAEDGWDLAVAACREGRPFTEDAAALGSALAEVHGALAERFGTSTRSGASVTPAMLRRLEATVPLAPELAGLADGLRGTLESVAHVDFEVQRVHGDFHLGQTLMAADADGVRRWKIIDFEGEPLKTLDERREADTPWRDVAGMLRSFDYAGAAATLDGADAGAASAWVEACSRAFEEAYRSGRAATADEALVLRAYMADKAIYEVMYEARNRPDWLPFPLSALAALATQADHHTTHEPTSTEDNR